jgi:hypothetical protein
LSRKREEGPSFEIPPQDQLWNCPQKQMADPVFTNRPFSCSGKVWQQEPPCRYSLPRLDCHASPFFRQDLGKQQTERQRVKILYLKIHVLSRGGVEKIYP